MKCSEARSFFTEISDRQEPLSQIPPNDLDYFASNGYVTVTTKDDYTRGLDEISILSQVTDQLNTERAQEQQADYALRLDKQKEHSFLFHFEGKDEKQELEQRIQSEMATVTKDQAELSALEANVNQLIEKKSTYDRMVPYDGEYVYLTGLGSIILKDLNVRNYRVADEEFSAFTAEIKAVYSELREIAEKAKWYVSVLVPQVPKMDEAQNTGGASPTSLIWSVAIGLAKLQGDPQQIGQRFTQALNLLQHFDATVPNKLMASEIITATTGQDVQGLESILKSIDHDLRKQGVPKELSAGVAATIMAGRGYDGTYPTDRFSQFRQVTSSFEAAAVLAVMNVQFETLHTRFQSFRSLFVSWGYTVSEDTEISSAFLAIGELNADEVGEKLKYIVEQLRNYLAYPLVAAAILASIPVFESHEVLDLMEKAVTLLSDYATGLERSELVALAVRTIHGVRNELVKEIDPTAKISETPVQFTYATHPGLLFWYFPVIIAHSSYHATFSGMGGFHPAHSHGIGGFAG